MKLLSILGRMVLGAIGTLLVAIAAIYVSLRIEDILDQRTFKFERYRSPEALQEALKSLFPLGSNAEKAMDQLLQSCARCILYDNRHKSDNAAYIVYCSYRTGLLSLAPMEIYTVELHADKNLGIVSYDAEQAF